MNEDLYFDTYGSAQFWLEDWYTIEELEELLKQAVLIQITLGRFALLKLSYHFHRFL